MGSNVWVRNRVIHDYFEVDLAVVWQTVQQDLPELRNQMFVALRGPLGKWRADTGRRFTFGKKAGSLPRSERRWEINR